MSKIWRVVSLVIALTILVPLVANAGIIGLYFPSSNDKLSVFMKDGRPFLRIEIPNFPDLPECNGYQLYRTTPFERTTLQLVSGGKGKGTGFPLWESRECLEAFWKATEGQRKVPTRIFVQDIDVYNDFFAYFINEEDLIRGFEAGEFFLAVMYQVQNGCCEQSPTEVFYTYQETLNGKVLLWQ